MPYRFTGLLIGAAIALTGCDNRPPNENPSADPTSVDASTDSTDRPAPATASKPAPRKRGVGGGTMVRPVTDVADLKRLLRGYRGRVVLLDFWATWCDPCVKGLPRMRAIQDKYGDRDLRIITVSFDKAADWETKVNKVLREKGKWNGPGVIVRNKEAEDEIVEWLATDWRGELPAYFLFNRDGDLKREILEINKDKLPPLEEMIEELIKQKAKPIEDEPSKGPPGRR